MNLKKARVVFPLFVGVAALSVVLGCNPAPDTGAEYRDEAADSAVLTAEERADRRQELTRRWQDAQDRLEELRAKATADGIENEVDAAVAEIDQEATELGRDLDEFGEESRLAWNEFEAKVENSLDNIGREIDQAAAEFE